MSVPLAIPKPGAQMSNGWVKSGVCPTRYPQTRRRDEQRVRRVECLSHSPPKLGASSCLALALPPCVVLRMHPFLRGRETFLREVLTETQSRDEGSLSIPELSPDRFAEGHRTYPIRAASQAELIRRHQCASISTGGGHSRAGAARRCSSL